MTFTLPIRTVSEANAHEHWRARQRRAKSHREVASWATSSAIGFTFPRGRPPNLERLLISLTRVAPHTLDSDNLPSSCKHIRDGIADALGIDDRDPRVAWLYAQRRGKPREYAVEVEITAVQAEQVGAAP